MIGSVLVICLGVLLFLQWSGGKYVPYDEYHGFLIPASTELIDSRDNYANFEWSYATFENGLPLTYQYALKRSGWQRLEPIDTIQVFKKGDNQIHLFTSTDYLHIAKKLVN